MRITPLLRFAAPSVSAFAVLAFAACSDGGTAPRALGASGRASLVVTPATAAGQPGNRTANQGEIEVCKDGTAGSFSVAISGGSTMTYNLTAGQCTVVAVNKTTAAGAVTVTELANAATQLVGVATTKISTGSPEVIQTSSESGPTVTSTDFNIFHGTLYVFTNRAVTTPTKKKKCDANKANKDPKIHNEDHDCRSEQGEQSDKKFVE